MAYGKEEHEKILAERQYEQAAEANQVNSAISTESHMVYELKQKREYLLRQIEAVQQAIDAVNLVSNF